MHTPLFASLFRFTFSLKVLLLSLLVGPFSWCQAETSDVHSAVADTLQGERYFMGLLPVNKKTQACVDCHALQLTDTLVWGPYASEIASAYRHKSADDLKAVLLSPAGEVAGRVHAGVDVPDSEFVNLKAYLDKVADGGVPSKKAGIKQLVLFLLLGALITWALLDLIFFHKVKIKAIPAFIFVLALGYQLFMLHVAAINLGRSPGFAPDQPIKFSHAIHAGENKTDCLYCHHSAEHGKSAGIPSAELCMNCHILIREGSHSGKWEINKVVNAVETQKATEWIRIHRLPDHVYFNHAQHVGVGGLSCQECHGDVEEMDIMKQHADLSMGWCVDCHRKSNVEAFSGNQYYQSYEHLRDIANRKDRAVPVADDLGANECMRCHY